MKIKVDTDNRGSSCFACGSYNSVRYLLIRQHNKPSGKMWARLCHNCLTIIVNKSQAIIAAEVAAIR